MDYHYRLCHHPSLSTLCQEQCVAVHEEKQSRVLLTMNRRTPISVRSLMYSKTHSEMIIYMSYMPFSGRCRFPLDILKWTSQRRGERLCGDYTLDLIKAFLARHVKFFEVASWHQCFADQQVGFWKEKKDWTALWRLILGKITQKVKFLYKHIEFCFLLWPESICFSKFVTKVK